jgi:hypothetical protein
MARRKVVAGAVERGAQHAGDAKLRVAHMFW